MNIKTDKVPSMKLKLPAASEANSAGISQSARQPPKDAVSQGSKTLTRGQIFKKQQQAAKEVVPAEPEQPVVAVVELISDPDVIEETGDP
jgi:hypothetical protein